MAHAPDPPCVRVVVAGAEALERAAALLRAGGLVAFPTETVYGLGADARNLLAVGRIFAAKGRPTDHQLIVHLPCAEAMTEWAATVPAAAWALAAAFWPGPLTLVLPRRTGVLDAVTGGQSSVALRVPAHPLALGLIQAAGALAAPSANRFGGVSPTCAAHVRDELGGAVDLILDGGPCAVGVESTIIGLVDGEPALLRPGGVGVQEIEAAFGRPLRRGTDGPRVPGALAAHYAPATPLELLPVAALWPRAAALAGEGLDVAVLTLGAVDRARSCSLDIALVTLPPRPEEYARGLYATLRDLDACWFDRLLVEAPPTTDAWLAVRDRLTRAARRPPPSFQTRSKRLKPHSPAYPSPEHP